MRREDMEQFTSNGAVRCKAHGRNGTQCGMPAIRGAVVCRLHGGSAPAVKRAAALRLAELVDPAIATLAREMNAADNSADRLRAANSILDRAGVVRRTDGLSAEEAHAVLVARLLILRDGAPPPDELDAEPEDQ